MIMYQKYEKYLIAIETIESIASMISLFCCVQFSNWFILFALISPIIVIGLNIPFHCLIDIMYQVEENKEKIDKILLKTASIPPLKEAKDCVKDTSLPAKTVPTIQFGETSEEVKDIVKGITLLSVEEAKNLLTKEQRTCTYNNEPCWWWLRTPSDSQRNAANVNYFGSVDYRGSFVGHVDGCVRPALILSNLKSSNLKSGDKFKFGGYTFTVISEKYALCDEAIARTAFREDWEAKDANAYEKSDVKKFLDNWCVEYFRH